MPSPKVCFASPENLMFKNTVKAYGIFCVKYYIEVRTTTLVKPKKHVIFAVVNLILLIDRIFLYGEDELSISTETKCSLLGFLAILSIVSSTSNYVVMNIEKIKNIKKKTKILPILYIFVQFGSHAMRMYNTSMQENRSNRSRNLIMFHLIYSFNANRLLIRHRNEWLYNKSEKILIKRLETMIFCFCLTHMQHRRFWGIISKTWESRPQADFFKTSNRFIYVYNPKLRVLKQKITASNLLNLFQPNRIVISIQTSLNAGQHWDGTAVTCVTHKLIFISETKQEKKIAALGYSPVSLMDNLETTDLLTQLGQYRINILTFDTISYSNQRSTSFIIIALLVNKI
ncbi:hypothetical protein AGLY_003194 [Aphis glycines]|uniref:Uncharacterized protein n=1 Tax=Aphis glycines TaxID=307491 RepID=A0A6G0U2W7_APHGL|nr:hypothetical protein AGLY_003194 [Aphis glycines]